MSPKLRRVGGPWLAALLLTGSAQAQTFNYLYFLGDSPNQLTSVIQTSDGKYLATENFKDGASLVRLKANGDLEWARRYGVPTLPLDAVMVRQHGDLFAWTGQSRGGQPHDPVLVAVKFNGDVQWARQINFGVPAEARALEISPQGDFWAGGVVWPNSGQTKPWMARFDPTGSLKWAKVFDCPKVCDLRSILLTSDGGAIGVGQEMFKFLWFSIKPRMFAFNVDDTGKPGWAFSYEVPNVYSGSWQGLVDLTRSGSTLYVAGNVTNLCGNPAQCSPHPPAILTAKLDELTGTLSSAWAVFPQDGRPAVASTIAGAPDHIAIGGLVQNLQAGGDEAFLFNAIPDDDLFEGMLYGDGSDPASSGIIDVAWSTQFAPVGAVFVMWQNDGALQRPAVVRTDFLLSAGAAFKHCERPVYLGAAQIGITKTALQLAPKDSPVTKLDLPAVSIDPIRQLCLGKVSK
ncbi:MAG TPA: hypothetical protein VF173_33195 [Thermoanaerobaculia bacterium]|nr:hypothetical protein [Thermoanaerobaculia bacterium]